MYLAKFIFRSFNTVMNKTCSYPLYLNRYAPVSTIAFKHVPRVQVLFPANIANCAEGLIGKVKVRDIDSVECFLSVYKKLIHGGHIRYL